MGDGDQHARQTARFDSRKLAELTKQHLPAETGSDDQGVPGTPKPYPLTMPRTTTLDDPFTTSLLAEVARRSKTIEVSPAQVDEALNYDPDDPDPSDDLT